MKNLTPQPERRHKKLIKPKLQLCIVGTFFGIAAICFLLQGLLFSSYLTGIAAEMPTGGQHLLEHTDKLLFKSMAVSFGLLLPVVTLVGIQVTFRIVGPIYRFEQHLAKIIKGEDPGACKIRKGDYLQGFCQLLNQAVAKLRSEAENDSSATEESEAA